MPHEIDQNFGEKIVKNAAKLIDCLEKNSSKMSRNRSIYYRRICQKCREINRFFGEK